MDMLSLTIYYYIQTLDFVTVRPNDGSRWETVHTLLNELSPPSGLTTVRTAELL
jgi:hypothetical protein